MTEHNAQTITVQYFALLREQRGLDNETLETTARTGRELYETLRSQHGFSLASEQMRVAINDAFADWDAPLTPGCSVTFIPPVAGG